MTQSLRCAFRDERGIETLEYAVLAVAFVTAIGGLWAALDPGLINTYADLGEWIAAVAAGM